MHVNNQQIRFMCFKILFEQFELNIIYANLLISTYYIYIYLHIYTYNDDVFKKQILINVATPSATPYSVVPSRHQRVKVSFLEI